jgi:oligoendopeptidase F
MFHTIRHRVPVILLAVMLVITAFAVWAEEGDVPERSAIDNKYKWDLTDMYASDEAWEADYSYIESKIPELESYKGKISQSGSDLLAFMKAYEDVRIKTENAGAYANMTLDTDTRDQKFIAMRDRIDALESKVSTATSWFNPELVSIPEESFDTWYKRMPDLGLYKHYFDDALRTKRYTLSEEEEKILSMSGDMENLAKGAASALRNTDMKFPTIKGSDGEDIQLSEARYYALMQSSDREVRKNAATALLETYIGYKNTLASLMASNVSADIFYARSRGYNSSLQMALDNDNIDTTVYTNLIETVHKNLGTLHKYIRVRRDAMGLEDLHLYDTSAPITGAPSEEWPYEKAVTTIETALQPLGPVYNKAMNDGFRAGWTDVYATQAKRSGAYSWGSYASHPYMLLNYENTLDDMFTIAHEMGHCMHTWHSQQKQPYIYADYTLFVAEVASTFNEALLMDYLLKTETDPEKRLIYVNQYIDNIRGTIITQVLFAEFELEMHRAMEAGEPLTAESLSEMYGKLLKEYYGPDLAWDDFYAYTWSRIPHFYRTFYVYKYATAMSAALALSENVLKGGEKELNAYIGFLSGGSSKYSLDLLKDAGVDMTSPQPIEAAMKKFGELVDELEVLTKARKG